MILLHLQPVWFKMSISINERLVPLPMYLIWVATSLTCKPLRFWCNIGLEIVSCLLGIGLGFSYVFSASSCFLRSSISLRFDCRQGISSVSGFFSFGFLIFFFFFSTFSSTPLRNFLLPNFLGMRAMIWSSSRLSSEGSESDKSSDCSPLTYSFSSSFSLRSASDCMASTSVLAFFMADFLPVLSNLFFNVDSDLCGSVYSVAMALDVTRSRLAASAAFRCSIRVICCLNNSSCLSLASLSIWYYSTAYSTLESPRAESSASLYKVSV